MRVTGRHRQVEDPRDHRRLVRRLLPGGAAVLVAGAAVALALANAPGPAGHRASTPARATDAIVVATPKLRVAPGVDDRRVPAISRSAPRVTMHAKPKVVARKFMTESLNLWPAPREKGKPLTVLKRGGKVAVTGVRRDAFAQILHDGQVRWVKRAYLADRMPKPEVGAAAGISSAPCPDGSGTESGLTSSAVRLFRSACHAFPALSSYGGWDGHGEHSSGKAIDFMVSDSSLGQSLADWARAHASELDLYDVIWQQHIWTPVRAGEGWRSMSDRGSATANHFDHVHIAVN